LAALKKILNGAGLRNFHLIGDSEPSFMAPEVRDWLRTQGADFTPVARQKSIYPDFMTYANSHTREDPEHRKLGTIDRAIRTIRDIAFRNNIETISPDQMKEIVSTYNEDPHKTLSQLMGFDLSPNLAWGNKNLQEELRDKIEDSQNKVLRRPGFLLEAG
jgi:hypothetical protein